MKFLKNTFATIVVVSSLAQANDSLNLTDAFKLNKKQMLELLQISHQLGQVGQDIKENMILKNAALNLLAAAAAKQAGWVTNYAQEELGQKIAAQYFTLLEKQHDGKAFEEHSKALFEAFKKFSESIGESLKNLKDELPSSQEAVSTAKKGAKEAATSVKDKIKDIINS